MLSSIINQNSQTGENKETVKELSNEEFVEMIRDCVCGDNSTTITIRQGNFVDNEEDTEDIEIKDFKLMFNCEVTEDKKADIIQIIGTSFDEFENEISDNFDINIDDVFDVYYTNDNDECEKDLHINLFATGEYIDIRVEG